MKKWFVMELDAKEHCANAAGDVALLGATDNILLDDLHKDQEKAVGV